MFYELLEDGTIGRSTLNANVAKSLGLTLQTDLEIVYGYNGKRYFKGTEPQRKETYQEKRRREYPSYAEQFDMIYWDKINQTNNWLNTIADIKKKYPKE